MHLTTKHNESRLAVMHGCIGTGSSGATIRMYIEKYVPADAGEKELNQETAPALQKLVDVALTLSNMQKLTGRDKPTVIT